MEPDLLDLVEVIAESSPREAPAFETVVTSPDYFGLSTATPLQRAICRIAEGLPIEDLVAMPLVEGLDAYPPEVQERCTWQWVLGTADGYAGWDAPPREVYLIAAIRCGKSLLISAWAYWASLTATWEGIGIRDGEVPRVPIVSTSKDNARAIGEHLRGVIHSRVGDDLSQRTRDALMDDSRATVETLEVMHPSGVTVEVRVAAGARAGSTLVSRWLVGCLFDEAPRMLPGEEGVVNFRDQARAVRGRVVSTMWAVGSPWAPIGEVYETVQSYQGPSRDRVVIRACGPALNPHYWTAERCWELRRRDPDAYWTDVCAEFAASEGAAYPVGDLEACTRSSEEEVLPPEPGVTYVAYTDPATRSNAWTLAVGGVRADGVLTMVYAREWLPDAGPLDPAVVLSEMAEDLRDYHVSTVVTDQHGYDYLAKEASRHGMTMELYVATGATNQRDAEEMRKRLHARTVSISPHPQVRDDLRRGKRQPTSTGWRYTWPQTADGRHCDFGPAVVRLLSCEAPPYVPPAEDPLDEWDPVEREMYERAIEQQEERQRDRQDPWGVEGGHDPWV